MENLSVNQPRNNNLVRNTLIAGGIGGGLGALNQYISQKLILRNSDEYVNTFKESINIAKDMKASNLVKRMEKRLADIQNNIIKPNKVNIKFIAKSAGIAAGVWAGIYLAYRGIKALFTKD